MDQIFSPSATARYGRRLQASAGRDRTQAPALSFNGVMASIVPPVTPTFKMVNFHISEPHPSASSYMYSGRGGAGNAMRIKPTEVTAGPTASGPASRTKLPPPPSNSIYATGRGGAGNMRRSERAIFSFDEELQQQERIRSQQAPVYHIGRGGAGNLVDEMKPRTYRQSSASSASSASSVECDRDGVRKSMEHAWQRLSRQFSHQ
ncbi:hypothetical protein ACJBU6_00635 [Exserohilum turcicum]